MKNRLGYSLKSTKNVIKILTATVSFIHCIDIKSFNHDSMPTNKVESNRYRFGIWLQYIGPQWRSALLLSYLIQQDTLIDKNNNYNRVLTSYDANTCREIISSIELSGLPELVMKHRSINGKQLEAILDVKPSKVFKLYFMALDYYNWEMKPEIIKKEKISTNLCVDTFLRNLSFQKLDF